MHHINKLNLRFTPLRQLLLDYTTVYKYAKAVVHSYTHSHIDPSVRKSSAVNFGTLKIGDVSVYYLKQGVPGLELMRLHRVVRSSSYRVAFEQINKSSVMKRKFDLLNYKIYFIWIMLKQILIYAKSSY